MRFSLSFDMDGAAFDGGEPTGIEDSARYDTEGTSVSSNSVDEVAQILYRLADRLEAAGSAWDDEPLNVRDSNGNTVGSWEVTES